MNTNPDTKIHERKLLYKELSYEIQGAAFEVRKNFGPGHKESLYQNAFAEELKIRGIKFEREKPIKIYSPKTKHVIGSYQPDFIVDNKVIVELKAVVKIPKLFLDQLFDYLRNSEFELGYFINFASPKLYIKRIIYTNDQKYNFRAI
jgi:GxxExxY protein